MTEPSILPPDGEFLLYTSEDGITRPEVRLSGETFWLNAKSPVEAHFEEAVKQVKALERSKPTSKKTGGK